MDLCYGIYDLSGSPSRQQLLGKVPYAFPDNAHHFVGSRSLEERRDPAISPMWASISSCSGFKEP